LLLQELVPEYKPISHQTRGRQKWNTGILNSKIEELARLAKDQDLENIKLKLKEIIPEYKPS
jgi:hypothetical protein